MSDLGCWSLTQDRCWPFLSFSLSQRGVALCLLPVPLTPPPCRTGVKSHPRSAPHGGPMSCGCGVSQPHLSAFPPCCPGAGCCAAAAFFRLPPPAESEGPRAGRPRPASLRVSVAPSAHLQAPGRDAERASGCVCVRPREPSPEHWWFCSGGSRSTSHT